MARASTSFPVQLSPWMRIVASPSGSTRSTSFRTDWRLGDLPMTLSKPKRCHLLLAQFRNLAPEAAGLEDLLHPAADILVAERLGDVVACPRLHGGDGVLHARVRGDHEHRQVGLAGVDAVQDLDPVRVGELVIEQDRVEDLLLGSFHRDLPSSTAVTADQCCERNSLRDQRISFSSSTTSMFPLSMPSLRG